MTRYGDIVNPRVTPPNEQAVAGQVENNAGGFVFSTGPWTQLDRFLILGAIGPTYYASERKMVKDNAGALAKCLAEDGKRFVDRIVEISDSGRAPKNDPAIFALAMAAGAKDDAVRAYALAQLPKVARIGTHLFHFAQDVQNFRKWGRGLRTAISSWYTKKSISQLAMQGIKYQQRDGWSHGDLLRLSHPVATSPQQDAVFRWMVGGFEAVDAVDRTRGKDKRPVASLRKFLPEMLSAFEELHKATDVKDVIRLIMAHELPREAIPTQWLKDPKVWEVLLPHMGITAMIRNLGKMTAIGLMKPLSAEVVRVCEALTNKDVITKGRVHPMQYLIASGIYRQGQGDKGKLTWKPNSLIVDALDAGFYEAFKTIEPTGKATLLALDVSGSMRCGLVAGAPGITPLVAEAAMAMVTIRVEKNWHIVGFSHNLVQIDIKASDSLAVVAQKISRVPMGATNCTIPMQYAAGAGLDVDVFQVYTDNETYMGNMHPFQALEAYRSKSGRAAKLAVVGLTATEFSIANPNDAGMLDVVGMDSHAPALLADFARGMV